MLDWTDGWGHDIALASGNLIPINSGKEFVLFHLLSIFVCSETLLRIAIEQQKNNLPCIMWHSVRNLQRT